jgi:pimeloyl-ACP methyl ester carboxylesterase
MTGISHKPKFSETAVINGLQTYYEVHGSGSPLFLLHGFTQSSKSWLPFVAGFSSEYEVYLVDLMGHGKSSPFTETISIRSAARQLKALMDHVGLEQTDAIGYSYGGEILFQLAILHPECLRSMIIVGSCGSWSAADFPEFTDYFSYKNAKNLPWMYEQQESEERIKNILDQFPNYSVRVSENELKRIQTRTLLVAGDHDPATPLNCLVKAKTQMPNAFLWVVPDSGHRVHMEKNKLHFVQISKEFLRGGSPI